MDQVSRIRARNMLSGLLSYCDDAEDDKEKAILMRLCVVVVNQLRMHANADTTLGYDVRTLNQKIEKCKSMSSFLALWEEATGLVHSYRDDLSS